MFKMTFFIFIPITFLISFILVYTDPKFGRLPKGERLERIKNSPNYKNGRFENLNYTPQLTSEKSRFMTMYDFLFRKEENIRPTTPIPFIKSDLKQISQELNYIVWFGHSSYLLQINGKRILVDPVFYDASPVSFFNKPFEGTDYYTADMIPGIDYLIITHDHWDHLDYKTVTKLRDRIDKVICPLGVGEHFEKWKFNQNAIIETDWYDSIDFGNDFKIHCLPARHFSGRGLKSNKSLWASFMIESDSKTIFLSGDGGYDTHFKDISEKYKTIDLAIMENGQYDNNWKYIHLMPEDLKNAIIDLNPNQVITGHHSKYALANHSWDQPIINNAKLALETNYSFITPVIGDIIEIK